MNPNPPEGLEIPLNKHCKLLDFNKNFEIYAFEKYPGVQTHPSAELKSHRRTLLNADFNPESESFTWIDSADRKKYLYLVHRLDAPTSGVLLATTNKKWSNILKQCFAERMVNKTYHAVVKANPRIKPGHWKDTLLKENKNGKIRVKRHKSGQIATSCMEIERFSNSAGKFLALVKLKPQSGRTHQLRVQCAARGMPIIGDKTYGDFSLNRKIAKNTKIERMFLHATQVEININIPDLPPLRWVVESPVPRDFIRILS
jgi:tRNA pseudouridine65 synthase